MSSLPSTSETSSRRFQRTVCGLSAPAFWLIDVATTITVSVRDADSQQLGLLLGWRRAVRAGLRVVDRLDRHRVDLAGGFRLQRLHQLAVRLDGRVEVGVELADRALVQLVQTGLDAVLVHVDQHAGPVRGRLHDAGAVVEFVDIAAVLRPDQDAKHDRRDREHAEDR